MTQAQIKAYVSGAGITLSLTFVAILFGMVLGLLLAFGRMSKSKTLQGITWTYIWVFRGTPMMLQLMIIYFGIPLISSALFGRPMGPERMTSAYVGLTLNTAAYLAEIFRAGILSIDKGQLEAGKALGMTNGQTMRKIIIPQTIRRIIPPFSNEFVMLLKDSSVVYILGIGDLTRTSRQFAAQGEVKFYFIAGAIYLVLTTIFTVLFDRLEKKYAKYE